MDIKEQAAYIKGLYDMVKLDGQEKCDPKVDKIVSAMIDLMLDMSENIAALEAECAELREYVEELDQDLGAVEEDLYFDDEDIDDEDEDDLDDDSGYDEVVCPACGEIICVDESLDLEDVICPACGEALADIDICDGNCEGCKEDCDNK